MGLCENSSASFFIFLFFYVISSYVEEEGWWPDSADGDFSKFIAFLYSLDSSIILFFFKLITGSFFDSYFHSFMFSEYIEGSHRSKNEKEWYKERMI